MNRALRIARHPERETPPGGYPAARRKRKGGNSGFDGVGALPVLALGGCDGQAHLLADSPRQEPADGMRLPAGGFHQFLGCCAAGPLQQVQDLGGLAAVAGAGGFLLAFGRFLRRTGLLPRLSLLRRNVGATCANTGRLSGFRLLQRRAPERFRLLQCSMSCCFSFLW